MWTYLTRLITRVTRVAAKIIYAAEAREISSIVKPLSIAAPMIGGDRAVENTIKAVPMALIAPR